MHRCTPRLFLSIKVDLSQSVEGVGCAAVFPDFDVFISLLVAFIFAAELCAIFLALTRILFHDCATFVIHSDSCNAVQDLGSLYEWLL